MGSMQWTDEESRYLKAIFSWQDRLERERNGGPRARATAKASAGEFRILLIGAKGAGKTALLRRFCDGKFQETPDTSNSRFERGGRRTIEIDSQMYTLDVLEFPAEHLGEDKHDSNTKSESATMMLEQALAITEAAIVVYDVCDLGSFQQAKTLYEKLQIHKQQLADRAEHEQAHKHKPSSFRNQKRKHSNSSAPGKKNRRPFALLLVGTKCDVDDKERHVSVENGRMTATSTSAGGTAAHTHNVLVRKRPASATPSVTARTTASAVVPDAKASAAANTAKTMATVTTSDAFLEVSAKTGAQVSEVFVRISRDILKQREQLQQEERERLAAAGGESSGSNTLGRMRSRASSTTRRRFGGFRTGFPFMRRAVAVDTP